MKFDVIIGNPPWGKSFSDKEIETYKGKFKATSNKSIESYDLFIEMALGIIRDNGLISYVIPEAILNVAAHESIRQMLLEKCSFKFISYLGNAFSNILCPCILMGIQKSSEPTSIGCLVTINNNTFMIRNRRNFNPASFYFNITDDENLCLEEIEGIENSAYLKDNASFALGIITGNNKEYIANSKLDGYEIILKGNDIRRYGIREAGNYIKFTPERFQQVAPTELYRAKEKLMYRFICDTPVFTYDDKQRLSLNSCNIVIPCISGLDIKYILAVLNSSIAHYYISKKFNSLKLLRSHIEQLPIPIVSDYEQQNITRYVNLLLDGSGDCYSLYNELDDCIFNLYKLSSNSIRIIKETLFVI